MTRPMSSFPLHFPMAPFPPLLACSTTAHQCHYKHHQRLTCNPPCSIAPPPPETTRQLPKSLLLLPDYCCVPLLPGLGTVANLAVAATAAYCHHLRPCHSRPTSFPARVALHTPSHSLKEVHVHVVRVKKPHLILFVLQFLKQFQL